MSATYIDTALLPVCEQIEWERFHFLDAAKRISDKEGGFPQWKIGEIAQSLEVIFRAAMTEGKTYEDAMDEATASIRS